MSWRAPSPPRPRCSRANALVDQWRHMQGSGAMEWSEWCEGSRCGREWWLLGGKPTDNGPSGHAAGRSSDEAPLLSMRSTRCHSSPLSRTVLSLNRLAGESSMLLLLLRGLEPATVLMLCWSIVDMSRALVGGFTTGAAGEAEESGASDAAMCVVKALWTPNMPSARPQHTPMPAPGAPNMMKNDPAAVDTNASSTSFSPSRVALSPPSRHFLSALASCRPPKRMLRACQKVAKPTREIQRTMAGTPSTVSTAASKGT
mmetsp:Transcript_25789/g.63993  ORF Transcript_25789/g.63993 Transcript_25789/m.63993 type:complete len:258 (+) Transcript_25789:864-1637(+)